MFIEDFYGLPHDVPFINVDTHEDTPLWVQEILIRDQAYTDPFAQKAHQEYASFGNTVLGQVQSVVCQGFWTVWLCDLGHMCCLLFPCLCWGLVSQRGVGTDPVVEDFDVLSDFMAGKVLIDEDVVVIHLVLQGREKRFSHSVIPADSDCSHGLVDPMFLAVLVHLFRTILAAVVTVEYEAFA